MRHSSQPVADGTNIRTMNDECFPSRHGSHVLNLAYLKLYKLSGRLSDRCTTLFENILKTELECSGDKDKGTLRYANCMHLTRWLKARKSYCSKSAQPISFFLPDFTISQALLYVLIDLNFRRFLPLIWSPEHALTSFHFCPFCNGVKGFIEVENQAQSQVYIGGQTSWDT